MLRFAIIACLVFLCAFCVSSFLYADAGARGASSESTVADDVATYRLNVGAKAERGAKNILLGWSEIPQRIVDITHESGNPVWGILAGTYQGTVKAIARTISGACDVATAPIDPDSPSFIQSDINVE